MYPRRKTRIFLLQNLYAQSYGAAKERIEAQQQDFYKKHTTLLEWDYYTAIHTALCEHQKELLGVIACLAPKFDLATMPRLHLLILMMAITEMTYYTKDTIDVRVSINEAIELAKRFSDEKGKNFISGVLDSFLKQRETLFLSSTPATFTLLDS